MKISFGFLWVIFVLASLSCAAESSNPFAACKEGNTEYIRQYIEHGGDPNAKTAPLPVPVFEGHSGTLLGMAVISNHVDIVQLLLDHGADPNLPTMGCTPLYLNLMNIKEPTWRLLPKHVALLACQLCRPGRPVVTLRMKSSKRQLWPLSRVSATCWLPTVPYPTKDHSGEDNSP